MKAIVFLLVMTGISLTLAQHCVTFKGIVGECVDRESCKPFKEAQTRSTYTELSLGEKKEYLVSWRCRERSAKVCCPNDTPYSEPPPSVDDHKNLRLLPQVCGKTSIISDRLFGGNTTAPLDYPWMALIATKSNISGVVKIDFTCGGTVINDRYILTSANCIANLTNRELVGVRLGEWDISTEIDCVDDFCTSPVQDIAIEEVLPYPGYVGIVYGKGLDLMNDIGLLRLANPINLTVENVAPICLPTTKRMREANLTDEILVMTGWGKTNNQEDNNHTTTKDFTSPRLLQIDVPIVPNRLCAEKYNKSDIGGIGFRQLCASGLKGISSCSGDAGGPMVLKMSSKKSDRFVQFGVISAGYRVCGIEDKPGILTNVLYYMDWILDTIKP